MRNRTNSGTGSTVYGLGGLTGSEMTLVNGPTWGGSGLGFDGLSQFGRIADFLSGGDFTVFARTSFTNPTPSTRQSIVAQYAANINERSWYFVTEGPVVGDPVRMAVSSDGTSGNAGFYNSTDDVYTTLDQCLVGQWLSNGDLNYWQDKMQRTLALSSGSAQATRFDATVDISIACQDANNPSSFGAQTFRALAFMTGAITTAQRETLTDMINEL